MPPPRRGAGALSGDRRPSSVRLSVCLMSRTSALTRKPKGLERRNFAQGYPRSHATPTPTSRSKGQKSRSRGAGAYCGGHLAAQLVTLNFLTKFVAFYLLAFHMAGESDRRSYIHLWCHCLRFWKVSLKISWPQSQVNVDQPWAESSTQVHIGEWAGICSSLTGDALDVLCAQLIAKLLASLLSHAY